MFKTILVPLDGSEIAERALPYAERLAEIFGARLVLHGAVPAVRMAKGKGSFSEFEALRERSDYLTDVINLALAASLEVDADVRVGDPRASILEAIQDRGADLVVMSTHGRGGLERMVRGSVADAILRESPVPVLLSPRQAHIRWTDAPVRVVLPLDGSELAALAIPYAAAIASSLKGTIHLLRAVGYEPEFDLSPFFRDTREEARRYLDSVAQRLNRQGLTTRQEVREGRPVSTILRVVEEQDADLVVMSSHGRGGVERAFLGSVADSVLQLALVPVLVVRSAPALAHENGETRVDDILKVRLTGQLAAA